MFTNLILMLYFVHRSTPGLLELLAPVKHGRVLLFLPPLVPENSSERSFFIEAGLTIKNFFVLTLLKSDIVPLFFFRDVMLRCEFFSLELIFEQVKNTLFMLFQLTNLHVGECAMILGFLQRSRLTSFVFVKLLQNLVSNLRPCLRLLSFQRKVTDFDSLLVRYLNILTFFIDNHLYLSLQLFGCVRLHHCHFWDRKLCESEFRVG